MAPPTMLMGKPLAVLEFDHEDLILEDETTSAELAYQYKPLPDAHHFRLVELHPGTQGARLECGISIQFFDDYNVPVYRAFSYTWTESRYDRLIIGDKPPVECQSFREQYSIRHPVWINGRRLLISTNLRDALRQIRHATLPVHLWIDAVCINQDDLDERARQVLLMSRIYHSAQSVWLWCGEGGSEAEVAMNMALKICQAGRTIVETGEDMPSKSKIMDATAMGMMGLYPIESSGWKAFVEFFQRPVFRRIWIVQEIVTARKIIAYCGKLEIDFGHIARSVDFITRCGWDTVLSNHYDARENNFAYVHAMWKIKEEWALRRADVRRRVIHATRNFEATNPKDKVFALLGIVNDFAHRRACDLSLCPEAHQTQTQLQERYPNIQMTRSGPETDCLKTLASVLDKFIKLESQKAIRASNKAVLTLLRETENDLLSSLYRNLWIFVMCCRIYIETKFEEATGGELKNNIITAEMSFLTENGNLNQFLLQAWQGIGVGYNALTEETPDSQKVKAFIAEFLGPVEQAFQKVRLLEGFPDVEQEYISELKRFHTPLSLALRELLDPDFDQTSCDFRGSEGESLLLSDNSPHCTVVAMATSIEQLGNSIHIACNTPDSPILRNILDSLCRHKVDLSEKFPGFVEEDVKIVTTIFADMSGWTEVKDGLYSKDFPYDPKNPELAELKALVETRNPKNFGEDHDEPCAHDQSAEHRHEVINNMPIQHWSWSSDISRLSDYHLSEAEIYREFTLRCLHEDDNLFMLSMIEPKSNLRLLNLPSWVPDLSAPTQHVSLAFPAYDIAVPYAAAIEESAVPGEQTPYIRWSGKNPRILYIKAHEIDQITLLSAVREDTNTLGAEDVKDWVSLTDHLPPTYAATSQSKETALWRTLIGNCARAPDCTYPAPRSYKKNFEALKNLFQLEVQMSGIPRNDQHSILHGANEGDKMWRTLFEESQPFAEAMDRVLYSRRLFVTRHGYLGIGPKTAKTGDLVTLIRGSRTPFLLRMDEGNGGVLDGRTEGAYELVGECYTHGIMAGEALRKPGFRWEEIGLC